MTDSAPGEPEGALFERRLEQLKLEALADFAAGAGHEMNNPLAVIAGRAQLLLGDETDPERRASLALIWAQAQRVHEMIADAMLFARPPVPQFEQIEWGALLRRVLREAAAELPERGVLLELACDQREADEIGRPSEGSALASPGMVSDQREAQGNHAVGGERSAGEERSVLLVGRLPNRPVAAQADPDQLTVALRALLRNAIEAVDCGGRVELTATADAECFVVEIDDDGPGIPAEARSHVFNPFYSGRQAGRGLGIGLCKAWRLVGLHGGRIDVGRSPLGGAQFRATIPYQPCPIDS